jgi:hypothetical protein
MPRVTVPSALRALALIAVAAPEQREISARPLPRADTVSWLADWPAA